MHATTSTAYAPPRSVPGLADGRRADAAATVPDRASIDERDLMDRLSRGAARAFAPRPVAIAPERRAAIEKDLVDALVAWSVLGPGGEPAIAVVDKHVGPLAARGGMSPATIADLARRRRLVEDALLDAARRLGVEADAGGPNRYQELAPLEIHRAVTGRYVPDEMRADMSALFARDPDARARMRDALRAAIAHLAPLRSSWGGARYVAALQDGLRMLDAPT